ncbi:MAG: hypothetical protein Q7L07_17490 [Pseudohongiella sp.]|nr:hypothetical protein [Pseudohongiella sp.]MDP2284974.1 hypothetical protein [Pseudohongiella sp.]
MTSYYTHHQQALNSGSTQLSSMPWAQITVAVQVFSVMVCNRKLRDEKLKWEVCLT